MNQERDQALKQTMQEAGMDESTKATMLKGIAVMIAEYEAMKAKLIELGQIHDTKPPLRWVSTGEPLVNLAEVIRKHMEGRT